MKHDFFHVISPAQFSKLLRNFSPVETTTLPLEEAFDRIMAETIIAPENLPLVNRSSMDGYAVRAADVFGASESNPAYLENMADLKIDELSKVILPHGSCMGITTGGTLPENADSVVMIEYSQELGSGTIEIRKSVAPGENVMLKGEDVALGQPVLIRGDRLRAQEIGILAALGITSLTVFRQPKAAIISTGDELVPIHATPRPGQVRDVNSSTLACLLQENHSTPATYGLIKDDLSSITSALATALQANDAVFISGGSSVGIRDLTIEAILSLPDAEILAHGVSVSPGKPTILATVKGKPVMGLPGQVTSAQVIMLLFGCPLMRHLGGDVRAFDTSRRPRIPAQLTANVSSRQGREDYIRVGLEFSTDHSVLAVPKKGKSGLLRTLVQCDGLVRIPAESEGLIAGSHVTVWMI
ncbi:MAG: molybdopterin molybdotransferase MoeA [Desulfoplanes sp.]|nr:molybdopterin molybdotransferase MoeA [Desulfoplanes sp.]